MSSSPMKYPLWIGFLVILTSILIPLLTPKFHSRQIFVYSMVMTLICCYILWACVYVSQIHLFITPTHKINH